MKQILIDGNFILHKNYHVFKNLSKGEIRTGTIYGFSREISYLKKRFCLPIVVTWDSRSFRKDLFSDYKATRVFKEYDSPYENIELVQQYLDMHKISQYRHSGYESDDLLYTLSRDGGIIYSKDRDVLQCLGENVSILRSLKEDLLDLDWFRKEYGFEFSRDSFILYKSVLGDPSDNIKGIPRFPKKELKAFLNHQHVSDKAKKLLEENAELIQRNKKLVSLVEIESPTRLHPQTIIPVNEWIEKTGIL